MDNFLSIIVNMLYFFITIGTSRLDLHFNTLCIRFYHCSFLYIYSEFYTSRSVTKESRNKKFFFSRNAYIYVNIQFKDSCLNKSCTSQHCDFFPILMKFQQITLRTSIKCGIDNFSKSFILFYLNTKNQKFCFYGYFGSFYQLLHFLIF